MKIKSEVKLNKAWGKRNAHVKVKESCKIKSDLKINESFEKKKSKQ